MSGVLPPVKISELPPYTGADNPDGTLPITIAGTTYGINTSKLGGSGGATPTLSQVIQQGPLPVFINGAGTRSFTLDDVIRINFCTEQNLNLGDIIGFTWDDLIDFPIGTNFYIDYPIGSLPVKIIPTVANSVYFSGTLIDESEIILEPSKRYRLTKVGWPRFDESWILSYEESVPLGVTEMNVDKSLSIEDAYKPINVNSGGLNYNALTFTQTSGTFFTGRKYYIATYVAGDNFTNIGGTNASGTTFTAIGPTAVNYTNGSTIVDITTSNILPDNSTVVINNTIVPSTGAGLTLNFGIGCLVQANGTLLSGSTLIIPNGVKCFLNHLQDLSFTVTYEVGSGLNGNYSTDEINTGTTWIDGKPIFRKVFYFNNGDGDIDISTLNVNEVMRDDVFRYGVDTIHNISYLNQSNVSVNGSSESILTCFVCSSSVVLADTVISLNYASTVQNLTLLDTPIITSLTANFYRIFEYTKTT